MKLDNYDRIFYNQNFTIGAENKLYINNIPDILHSSFKRTYDLMYSNNGIEEPYFHKESFLFHEDGSTNLYQFEYCVLRILEADRAVFTYVNMKTIKYDKNYKNFKELGKYVRKLKIKTILIDDSPNNNTEEKTNTANTNS